MLSLSSSCLNTISLQVIKFIKETDKFDRSLQADFAISLKEEHTNIKRNLLKKIIAIIVYLSFGLSLITVWAFITWSESLFLEIFTYFSSNVVNLMNSFQFFVFLKCMQCRYKWLNDIVTNLICKSQKKLEKFSDMVFYRDILKNAGKNG